MSAITERLSTAIADRYRIERHFGAGVMGQGPNEGGALSGITKLKAKMSAKR